ncbi:MAG: helix-hairpin-helix domain-containing protein [Saprospiraceae bacterium]|nr:helix-hairpin-helix domain-containing protein [Saprospiraceae bacterium]
MRFFAACLVFIIAFFPSDIHGQDSIAILPGNLLEDLLENNDEANYDFFTLYDDLQEYLKNPLNINTASEEDFQNLQMLTDIQIADILDYRDQYGPFISKYELQSIPSLDLGILKAIVPLVTEGGERKNHTFRSIMDESTSTVFLKTKRVLQDRKGFLEDKYLGDPNHLFARYNFSSGRNVRAGVTMEKDPGEAFFSGSNKNGFDYYSGFVHIRDVLPLFSTLNFGDYTISMGQGLIVHNSFNGGKSSYVMDVKKGGRPIRPYSSVTEANFFRGTAATLDLSSSLKLSLFASGKRIDGAVSIDSTIDTGFATFSSIRVDGFHRTESEIANENSLSQRSYGGILKYKKRNFSFALNALNQNFSIPLQNLQTLYRKYRFSGDQLTNLSADFSYRYKNFNTFGEFARSDNGGTALISGLLTSLGRDVDATLIFRNFSKDYQVLNANAFSESTLPINERGVYFGLEFRPSKKITFSTYYDTWQHPWLRFQVDAPSHGKEILFKITYNEKRKLNAYVQYRIEQKMRNGSSEFNKIDPLITTTQHRARIHLSHTLNKNLKLRYRVEGSHFDRGGEKTYGYMIYNDIIYKPIGRSFSFTARYSMFDTDGFDTRIYTYENDILYEFSIPFFADRGIRYYINWRQRLNRHLTFQFRFSKTHFQNRESISSGNQFIDGNQLSEVKALVKYKF